LACVNLVAPISLNFVDRALIEIKPRRKIDRIAANPDPIDRQVRRRGLYDTDCLDRQSALPRLSRRDLGIGRQVQTA